MMRLNRSLARTFLAAMAVLVLGADEPPSPSRPDRQDVRRDRYGDPLPDGALARLGTARLVHIGLRSAAVSADGTLAASGGDDFKIRLWDTATGRLVRAIDAPDRPAALLLAPTGLRLFAVYGSFVCCWDAATGAKRWQSNTRLNGWAEALVLASGVLVSVHNGQLECSVPWPDSPDARDKTNYYHRQRIVRLWDAATGRELPLPPSLDATALGKLEPFVAPNLFHDIAFSADGRLAAVMAAQAEPNRQGEPKTWINRWIYANRTIRIVELPSGKIVRTLATNEVLPPDAALANREVRLLTALANDGQSLAFADDAGIWRLRIATGEKDAIAKVQRKKVEKLRFVDNGRVAVLFADRVVEVWDIAARQKVAAPAVREEFFEPSSAGPAAARRDGDRINLIDRASGRDKLALEGHGSAPHVRFSFAKEKVLYSRDPDRAYSWDTSSWTVRESLAFASTSYRASLEKRLFVDVPQGHDRAQLRDIASKRVVRELPIGAEPLFFSEAGNRLCVQREKSLDFFDVDSGRHLSAIAKEPSWFGYSPHEHLSRSGRYFAKLNSNASEDVLSYSEWMDVYDVGSGKVVQSLRPKTLNEGHGVVRRVWFSGDERLVLGEVQTLFGPGAGHLPSKVGIALWDIATGDVLQEVAVQPVQAVPWTSPLLYRYVGQLALSNDHRLIAAVNDRDKTANIAIWEVASGTKRGDLRGHQGPIYGFAFSHDDRQLASSSDDTTVLIWDMDRPLQPVARRERLGAKELESLWTILRDGDGAAADAAIWSLVYAAQDSVPFLKSRLRAAPAPDAARVAGWIADLSSESFAVRSRAETQLAGCGELVLSALAAASKTPDSLEQRRRLESLLSTARAAARPFGTPERVRQSRALEALERSATADAAALVHDLAGGAADARLTIEARRVLARMQSRAQPR
jgi:WD40 repeat protein